MTTPTRRTITVADIRRWHPCYDPACYVAEDWSGTALDVLRRTDVPAADRLWVVLREEVLDARTLRLFAVWCARRALALIAHPDARSVAACDVAERYANGKATSAELAAYAAAYDAADDAAYDAARAAQVEHLIEMIEPSTTHLPPTTPPAPRCRRRGHE